MAQPTTIRLRLRPLSAKDTEYLVEQRLGVKFIPIEVVDFVYERTNGHPFSSLETALALRDNGIVRVDEKNQAVANDAAQSNRVQTPKSLQEVVIGRRRGQPADRYSLVIARASSLHRRHPRKIMRIRPDW